MAAEEACREEAGEAEEAEAVGGGADGGAGVRAEEHAMNLSPCLPPFPPMSSPLMNSTLKHSTMCACEAPTSMKTRRRRMEEEAEVEEEGGEEGEEEGRWMNGRRYSPQPYRVHSMH